MSPKKARIKDIARRAGVSTGTVDRVLHDRGEVADGTRQKILKIASDMEYSPNYLARALRTRKGLHLASLIPFPSEENAFWLRHPLGLKKAIAEIEPFPLKLTQVNFDLVDEIDFQDKTLQVHHLCPDGVILAPIFKAESIEFCRQLTKMNIPFVFLDACVDETDFLSYTGEDIFQSGKVAGQLAEMVTQKGKDILIINIVRNLQNVHHLNTRTQGFLSFFSGKAGEGYSIYELVISDPLPENISRETSKILRKHKNITTIFVTGSRSYKIADFIKSSVFDPMNIIGYDLLTRNVEHLKAGTIKFLIGQRPEEQAYRGIRKLFDFLSRNKVPVKKEYLPVDIVTSENVKYFINSY